MYFTCFTQHCVFKIYSCCYVDISFFASCCCLIFHGRLPSRFTTHPRSAGHESCLHLQVPGMTLGQTFLGTALRGDVGEFHWGYIPGGGSRSHAHSSSTRTPSKARVFSPAPHCLPVVLPCSSLPSSWGQGGLAPNPCPQAVLRMPPVFTPRPAQYLRPKRSEDGSTHPLWVTNGRS